MKVNKHLLAKWYINSIRNVTNKNKVRNSNINENLRVFDYLATSDYKFLNELLNYIDIYNKGDRNITRKILLDKLTFCARNKFIYNDIVEIIYNQRKEAKAMSCYWKEIYHIIKDEELDELLAYLDDNNYMMCAKYLYGSDYNITYEELKENRDKIRLEIINKLGLIIGKKPLSLDELINSKNKTDTDKIYVKKAKRNKLKEIGIDNINLFVNDYIDNFIDENWR